MATRLSFTRRESALVDKRQEARLRLEVARVSAGDEDEPPFVAALEDVSSFGCRLGGTPALATGDRVWLRLPGAAPVIATVIWARDGTAGCRFATPIAQGLMRALLAGAV